MARTGPVEYVVIAFPGNRFKGEIVPAVAELVDTGIVRILDVAFIKKDAEATPPCSSTTRWTTSLPSGSRHRRGGRGRAER